MPDGLREFNANRDRLRRLSEQRVQAGMNPFPSAEELAAHPNTDKVAAHADLMEAGKRILAEKARPGVGSLAFHIWDDDRDAQRWG